MIIRPSYLILGGLLAAGIAGCKPQPIVPIDRQPAAPQTNIDIRTTNDQPPALPMPAPPTNSKPNVEVQVGGGKGVDVNVGTPPSTSPTPPDGR